MCARRPRSPADPLAAPAAAMLLALLALLAPATAKASSEEFLVGIGKADMTGPIA